MHDDARVILWGSVVGRNHDDHVKNIAILMDRRGAWRLSPAFDISYAWDPNGAWTQQHQMSINRKREHIEREDLLALAAAAGMKSTQANDMLDRVIAAFRSWPETAATTGVPEEDMLRIQRALQQL